MEKLLCGGEGLAFLHALRVKRSERISAVEVAAIEEDDRVGVDLPRGGLYIHNKSGPRV